MGKLLVIAILLVVGYFAYQNRERLFVRDPLGSVARDGIKEAGAQVYVNYSNDVLLENDNAPMYFNLLEKAQPVAAPVALKCIHYLVCLASGYPATETFAVPGAQMESMTNRQVRFRDGHGQQAVVTLR